MRLPKKNYLIFVSVMALLGLTVAPGSGAFFIPIVGNFFKPVVDALSPQLAIETSIALAPYGDMNKNGQIDSGDSVTFWYKIKNPTPKSYTFSTLKTGIPRDQLNYIRNLYGVTGISDTNGTLIIPNLRVMATSESQISFDARINYASDTDKVIFTDAELVDSTNASVLKAAHKEIVAKKLTQQELEKLVPPPIKKGDANGQ